MNIRPPIDFQLTPYENFVFDFSGVLFQCDYMKFVRQAFPSHTNHAELADMIFKSEIFSEYDKNLLDTEDVTDKLSKLVGCQYKDIDNLISAIKQHMVPIEEMVVLLHALKGRNVRLFGLTNMPKEIFDHLMSQYEFLSLFEHVASSSYLGLAKPELAIYQHVIDKNKINPSKTVFIDDRSVNLPPAEQLGVKTFLFTNVGQLITDLRMATNATSRCLQESDTQIEQSRGQMSP